MKKIEVKIKITNIENWSVDWENEDEVKKEFKDLSFNMRMGIYERCGVDIDNIHIELSLADNCNSIINVLESKDYGADGVGLSSDEISSLI